MEKRIMRGLFLAACLNISLLALPVHADPAWRTMPPEERQQMRQQMREHWQQMPPVQQRGMYRQEYRQEGRERWSQVAPDERQRMREEMRGQGRQGWGGNRW